MARRRKSTHRKTRRRHIGPKTGPKAKITNVIKTLRAIKKQM